RPAQQPPPGQGAGALGANGVVVQDQAGQRGQAAPGAQQLDGAGAESVGRQAEAADGAEVAEVGPGGHALVPEPAGGEVERLQRGEGDVGEQGQDQLGRLAVQVQLAEAGAEGGAGQAGGHLVDRLGAIGVQGEGVDV